MTNSNYEDGPLWTIGEASKRIGRSVPTLRRWHAEGLLVPTLVFRDGTRVYSRQDVRDGIALISAAPQDTDVEEVEDIDVEDR